MTKSEQKRMAVLEHNQRHERSLLDSQVRPLFHWFYLLCGVRDRMRKERRARHGRVMMAVTLAAGLGAIQ